MGGAQMTNEFSKEQMDQFFLEVSRDMEKWEKDVCETKTKKYERDFNDYEVKRIFKWQYRKEDKFQSSRSSSVTSVTSLSSQASMQECDTPRPFNMKTRFGGKWTNQGPPRQYQGSKSRQPQVINLSDHILTPKQEDLLQRGLTFSPAKSLDAFTAIKDVHLFARKLVLKRHFEKSTSDSQIDVADDQQVVDMLESLLDEQNSTPVSGFPTHLYSKSKNFPPLSTCPAIDVFVKMVSGDVEKLCTNKKFNKDPQINETIIEIQKWSDVTIKQADKGGNVVIWPNKLYEKQAQKLLTDKACYKKLYYNPLTEFQQELVTIVTHAFEAGTIPKKLMDAIALVKPRMPTLYLIPKVHKDPLNPPGRPIVSGNEGLCELACKVVDFYLKPLVHTLPSFIQDTTAALRSFDGLVIHDDSILVTADIESLYTSIKHQDGLRAVSWFLEAGGFEGGLADFILQLLRYILTHNCFMFSDQIYLQLQGTAMGAACAPSYANLFLGAWERGIFLSDPVVHIDKVHHWIRYIDDVFFVWEGTIEQLNDFMAGLNTNDLNIRLTFSHGRQVNFLDLDVCVSSQGFIETNVYRKPTATNTLLHASSSHRQSTIKGIPIGQHLRIKRICSSQEKFRDQAHDLYQRFRERGYSHRQIRTGYKRACSTSRDELLYQTTSKKNYDSQFWPIDVSSIFRTLVKYSYVSIDY
ncbi:uncharacterized protein LOC143781279 [Ranitomeya variabilis]|uniref:uncharacterized protein LOC143781279 n=1 Tax=Ranitomeya variabilis TaxID=490064 RepID=UPI00405759D1